MFNFHNSILLSTLLVVSVAFVVLPGPALAQSTVDTGLIPCDTDCNFGHLYTLVSKLIDFALFTLAIPLATISFAIAGWMFLTSGDNEGQRTKAKGIILWAFIGLVIALAAWLIVNTVVKGLVKEEYQGQLHLQDVGN